MLQQFNVSDFLDWDEQKQLKVNQDFQRRKVWTDAASAYLIDTILRGLPIHKVYIRTIQDLKRKKAIREIVDGQQRVAAIIKFAADKLTLTKRTNEFAGKTYSELDPELQSKFLSYPIAVEQLIDASDDDVLEIFARLNSYNVKLNAAELRHAEYQGDFKWSVHDEALKWKVLWDEFKVVSIRQRLRMADDSLMSEMFGILLEGVTQGGQGRINKLYKKYDSTFPNQKEIIQRIDKVLSYIVNEFPSVLIDPISNAPHFLMLFAATAYAIVGIPQGEMEGAMPERNKLALSEVGIALENVAKLGEIIESDAPKREWLDFWRASKSTTQGLASRRVRFPTYYRALLPKHL